MPLEWLWFISISLLIVAFTLANSFVTMDTPEVKLVFPSWTLKRTEEVAETMYEYRENQKIR